MGLKTMSLLSGATISASGGTALAFAEDGVTIPNGIHLIVPGDTSYITRRQVTAKYRPPAIDAKTGNYGKDKKSLTLVKPIQLADGSVVFETLRIEREMHPSSADADAVEMLKLGAQMLTDSDCTAFWSTGSLS